MVVGGRSIYYMTGPDGERMHGHWEILRADAPHSFEFRDGFANADGTPDNNAPVMRVIFTFEDTNAGSRLTTTTWFDSVSDMEMLVEMGMEEGLHTAMAQIDHVVADLTSFAANSGTVLQVLDDTHVRITRIIRGPIEKVWDAHQKPELMRR